MKRSIIKPILFGILFGAAAFFAPFILLKVLLLFMLISFLFKAFFWRHHGGMQYKMLMADHIRNMSDEDYAAFKDKFNNKCGGCYCHGHCGCSSGCGSRTKQENSAQ